MKKKLALTVLVSGSFDPPTLGHRFLAERACACFERVIVCAFVNENKRYLFSEEERLELLRETCAGLPVSEVRLFPGVLADFCAQNGVSVILRGVRGEEDLGYEQAMAEENYRRFPGAVTVFVPCPPTLRGCSSTLARQTLQKGEAPTAFMGEIPARAALRLLRSRRGGGK
ncbi:MAG: adenylyltransferase/cytidyltransferase family protein [Clostridia bacterium]|nr:adenylyltransferase/cytidyltransferase family protein [Clostridia bacterium]